ncbi:hypothetical protein ACOSP7_005172 [Xanthoceras sorbifolium]
MIIIDEIGYIECNDFDPCHSFFVNICCLSGKGEHMLLPNFLPCNLNLPFSEIKITDESSLLGLHVLKQAHLMSRGHLIRIFCQQIKNLNAFSDVFVSCRKL